MNSPEKFALFIEQNIDKVIKYYFVLYLCLLNPQYLSIPICLITRSDGNANGSIIQIFDEVLVNLSKSGINVIGEAYDGDTAWLSRVIFIKIRLKYAKNHRNGYIKFGQNIQYQNAQT